MKHLAQFKISLVFMASEVHRVRHSALFPAAVPRSLGPLGTNLVETSPAGALTSAIFALAYLQTWTEKRSDQGPEEKHFSSLTQKLDTVDIVFAVWSLYVKDWV